MSTPKITKFSYSAKDYAALRDDLLSRIPVLTNGNWTDLNESDSGVAIVELLAAMMDQLMFYMDMSANESFLPTARQKADVNNLAALIDYKPASISSASAVVEFDLSSLPGSVTWPVTIPVYTKVGTSGTGGVSFVTTLLEGATDPTPIPVVVSGPSSPNIVRMLAVQGNHVQDIFKSDGSANQRFRLSQANIDTKTVLAAIDGTPWSVQSSFVDAQLNDELFTVDQDAKGNVFVTFGDGKFGQVPPNASTITVDYIVSQGTSGTVGATKINVLQSNLVDNASAVVFQRVGISNPLASQPGLQPETIERTRTLAPALLAALFTAKSKDDYNALTLQASTAITKVNTWGEAEETPPNVSMFNRVKIVFTGYDSNVRVLGPAPAPSASEYADVKSVVQSYLASRKIITTRNVIVDPQFVHVIMTVKVFSDLTRYDSTTVANAVKDAIAVNFGFNAVTFGQDIYPSQIQDAIGSVTGVTWSTLSIAANPIAFDTLGSRYIMDTSVTPNAVAGIILKKFEVPIFEDDAITGLTSGITHLVIQVVDGIDEPTN